MSYNNKEALEGYRNTSGKENFSENYMSVMQVHPWLQSDMTVFGIYPVVLVANLLLFVVVLANRKLCSEPWRWLVAHTALCIFTLALLNYTTVFTTLFHMTSLITTKVCPGFAVLQKFFGKMIVVSYALLAIERFRALHLGKEKEGGMGKLGIILSLVVSWLLLIVVQILWLTVEPRGHNLFHYFSITPQNFTTCDYNWNFIPGSAKIVVVAWAMLTSVVVFIGSLVVGCRETTTPSMKKNIMAPTLAFVFFFLVFHLGPEMVLLSAALIYTGTAGIILHLFYLMAWILFPVTWLITWSCSGDLCQRQCHHEEVEG